MTNIFSQISELERLGEFEQVIKLVKDELKNENDQERRFQLELVELEANYHLRNFRLAKKNVERLIKTRTLEHFPIILGDAHNLLGKIFRIHQRYEEALNHYHIAENAYKKAQNHLGLAKIYINIGNANIFLENFKVAKKFHKKALELSESIENYDLIANCYLNLGGLHYQNGEVEEAFKNYNKALNIFETINDLPALAAVHLNIAETLFLRRNFKESVKYSAEAVNLYKRQRNILGQNLALKSFARAEKGAGNHEIAAKSFEELLKQQDSSLNEDVLLELGECYLELRKNTQAEDVFQFLRKTPNYSPQSRGYALNSLAILSGEKLDFNAAIAYYMELLEVLDSLPIPDEDSKASTLGNLGFMNLKLSNSEEAFRYLETALEYFRKHKVWEEAIVLLNNFTAQFAIKREYDRCMSFIENYSLPLVKKAKEKDWQNHLRADVAFLYYLTGKTEKGVRYWKKNVSYELLEEYKPIFTSSHEIADSEKDRIEKELDEFLTQL